MSLLALSGLLLRLDTLFILPQALYIRWPPFCFTTRNSFGHFAIMLYSFLILSLSCCVLVTRADRGTIAHNTPTVCNTEPTVVAVALIDSAVLASGVSTTNRTGSMKRPTLAGGASKMNGTAAAPPFISPVKAPREQLKEQREHTSGRALHPRLWERGLSKRSGSVSYDASCNNDPPANSGYKPALPTARAERPKPAYFL